MYQNTRELRHGERGTCTHWHWSMNCYKLFESHLGNTHKNKNFTVPSATPIPGIYPTEYIPQHIFQTTLKETWRKMLTATEFTVVYDLKQLKHPSMGNGLKLLWDLQTMEYCAAFMKIKIALDVPI